MGWFLYSFLTLDVHQHYYQFTRQIYFWCSATWTASADRCLTRLIAFVLPQIEAFLARGRRGACVLEVPAFLFARRHERLPEWVDMLLRRGTQRSRPKITVNRWLSSAIKLEVRLPAQHPLHPWLILLIYRRNWVRIMTAFRSLRSMDQLLEDELPMELRFF